MIHERCLINIYAHKRILNERTSDDKDNNI